VRVKAPEDFASVLHRQVVMVVMEEHGPLRVSVDELDDAL